VGSGLVLGALTLGAQQYYPQQYQPQRDDRYDRDRDRDRDFDRNILLNRVRTDLDNAQAHTIPFTSDRWRIARAKESVIEFQQRLNTGDYARRELDTAISNMQRVVDANRLPDRWQQFLSNDVNRLREMENRLDGGL
jgi:hypothetical protein